MGGKYSYPQRHFETIHSVHLLHCSMLEIIKPPEKLQHLRPI